VRLRRTRRRSDRAVHASIFLEGANLVSDRTINILLILAGTVLILIAIVYWVEPAKSLPSLMPGHEAGSDHHHVKHGIAAFLLGIGAFVLAWFRSGPRHSAA
jgi:hypothetical protein